MASYAASRPITEGVEQKRIRFARNRHNVGGLEDRDFRRGIDGDDSPDGALADYIVRDLRLSMAGSATVTHKKIIGEPHKRVS